MSRKPAVPRASGPRSPPNETIARAKSPEAGRASRIRPARAAPKAIPTQAEKDAEKERKKQDAIARRKALEEEGAGVDKINQQLQVEVSCLNMNPKGRGTMTDGEALVYLQNLNNQVGQLQLQLTATQTRVEEAETIDKETLVRLAHKKASLRNRCVALRQEIMELEESCNQHDDQAQHLFASRDDMRELLQRGAEELQQLRRELVERQGEKSILVGDQASVARLGEGQRAQCEAAEAQINQLAQALENEDSRVTQEHQHLRDAHVTHGERVAHQKREMAQVVAGAPEQLQVMREETSRCRQVAEEKRHELHKAHKMLDECKEFEVHYADIVHHRAAEVHRAERARDAARASRESMEAEIAQLTGNTAHMQQRSVDMTQYNRELMQNQVKAVNHHSVIVQEGIMKDVKEFLKANPDIKSSSQSKENSELQDRAARLNLAGFAANLAPAGRVGTQRQARR